MLALERDNWMFVLAVVYQTSQMSFIQMYRIWIRVVIFFTRASNKNAN